MFITHPQPHPPASTLEYAKESTCKHLLSISKAANLSCLVRSHILLMCYDEACAASDVGLH